MDTLEGPGCPLSLYEHCVAGVPAQVLAHCLAVSVTSIRYRGPKWITQWAPGEWVPSSLLRFVVFMSFRGQACWPLMFCVPVPSTKVFPPTLEDSHALDASRALHDICFPAEYLHPLGYLKPRISETRLNSPPLLEVAHPRYHSAPS